MLRTTYLELVDGVQRIDAGHSAVLEAQNGRAEVAGAIARRLAYQHEIRPKRTGNLYL